LEARCSSLSAGSARAAITGRRAGRRAAQEEEEDEDEEWGSRPTRRAGPAARGAAGPDRRELNALGARRCIIARCAGRGCE